MDGGTPPLASPTNAEMTVYVTGNLHVPQFSGTPYSVAIKRSAAAGSVLIVLQATDPDPGVSIIITIMYSSCIKLRKKY